VARLKSGVTLDNVQAMLTARTALCPFVLQVRSLESYMTGRLRPLALGALAAALLIGLVCAANVDSLLIAREAYRVTEFATRTALGATRRDLMRLVLIEMGLLGFFGTLAGLMVADVALALVGRVIPDQYTLFGLPDVTLRVVGFAGSFGAAVVLAGVVTAWMVWRKTQPALGSLRAEARKIKWLRFIMAASQSATATVLLVGGALLVRSYINLWFQNTGFSGNVEVISVSYPEMQASQQLIMEINATVTQLRRIPGVTNAGAISSPFLSNIGRAGGAPTARIAGRAIALAADEITVGFFEAVGAQCRAGRLLGAHDHGWNAVLANEAFVRWLLPDVDMKSAVGKVGTLPDGSLMEIVGVIQDTFSSSLDKLPAPKLYMPIAKPWASMPVHYVLRLSKRSTSFETAARFAVAAVNADAVITQSGFLDERLAGTVKTRSFATMILGSFAAAGLGITASGLFGMFAFVVARRTRELAIRRAIGAPRRHIVWVVIREAATAAACGSAIGLVIGFWLSKYLQSEVYGISTSDSLSLTTAALSMVIAASVAAYIPARRALRLSPTEALRVE
jgi:predicted permease